MSPNQVTISAIENIANDLQLILGHLKVMNNNNPKLDNQSINSFHEIENASKRLAKNITILQKIYIF